MQDLVEKKHVWQSLPAITLLALALRLVAIRFLYRNSWNTYENHLLFGFEIGRIARSLASGHGYGNPMFVETGPTAWMTPVYPYLLAGIFKLFGIYSRASAFVILGLNALFSALVCLPMFHIARRNFGRTVAIVACWMWALFPYSIYISSAFVWETCLSGLLLSLLFLSTIKLRERFRSLSWLGFGALWGLSALTNASILALLPFFAGWALYPLWRNRRTWLATAALVVLGLGITLLPWQVRNYRTFQKVVPLRSNFWLELWLGNNGHTESWADLKDHPSINKQEQAEFVRLGEASYMQEKRHQVLRIISEHPAFYLALSARRIVYLWTGFWNLQPSNLAIELYDPANVFLTVPLIGLMLLGLWQTIRTVRGVILPYLFLLIVYPLVFYLTHTEIRYRHVIDPEIVILAALGARYLFVEAKIGRVASS